MNDKKILMNEMCEKCNISRDMLKYYESKGLIAPQRSEKGYRIYDEYCVEKIRKILRYRNMGLTVDEVCQLLGEGDIDTFYDNLSGVITKMEDQIMELRNGIEELHTLKQDISWSMEYIDHAAISRNYCFCKGCLEMRNNQNRQFCSGEMRILHRQDGKVVLKEIHENAVLVYVGREPQECVGCRRKRELHIPKTFRKIICYENQEQINEEIKKIYEFAEKLGYQLSNEVYCFRRLMIVGLCMDINIPILESKS